ncbi:hypothetical protein Bpfe_031020 [Biomphalaria pfeifferi]|uniref:Uncharacterized protein n=1 Tax=Biomphalaria pfeifferi TaxID=112525 RepID=A0AAD8ANL1_BIOPF|nr:hypothetical protein Bpfe_031020 [Biomphalaria pfeifferi]
MESHELMRLLIPEKKVKKVAEFTGLTTSIIYQERRAAGNGFNQTGTRNTIDRLDLICEFSLGHQPEAVRILGERYLQMYLNYMNPPQEVVTVNDLLIELGEVSRECGEAVAALASRQSINKCSVEVAQAKQRLEKALAMVSCLENQ